ncbi:polysaccharide biosynthesis protein [Cytobacillus depressus]|uniref:Polysaccharide biosynthesis protein n=1 Tax=Cytobacillus depressus TaxID=1602942 RepID=A0A6L3V821_9BACI|nr:DUF5693 family protein [Cytobacillus depressus]KAB2336747.1 polysaccharide biosynthesis protein [Cytobacillus depressus]
MMNNTFVKSTLILSIATLASKILGSIFRIPLQNIAGDEVLGIFTLVYPVYMVALILSVAGIPIAISQLISEAAAHKDDNRIWKIYRTATILAILFGITSFSLIFGFSHQIAEVLGGQSTRLALIVVAATLLIAPYMAVYRGYFQGFQNMSPTAVSQVLEQLIRVGIILLSAYILVQQNRSNEVIAGGIMIGSFVGAFLSAVYLQWLFHRSPLKPKRIKERYTFRDFKGMSKDILYISLPICIGAITMALLNFVDSVTIPSSLKNAGEKANEITYLYGIYGRGLSLVQIATVFSSSIVLPLIPLITKTLAEQKQKKARDIVERTHFLTHLVSWPAAFGLFALTLPINLALFTDLKGSDVLGIIGLSSVFTSLSILGTGVLQGMNLAKQGAYIIVGGVLVKIVTNIVLVKFFGLVGAAYSTLFVYILIFIVNTYFIWKTIPFAFWGRKVTSIVLSSAVMGLAIGLPTMYFHIDQWGRKTALLYTVAAIAIGAAIYFIMLILTKGFSIAELKGLPVVSKLFRSSTNQPADAVNKNNLGKGGKKLKKFLWGLLIASLLLAIPGIAQRYQAEWKNNAYEMIIPYGDIEDTSLHGTDLPVEKILKRLKQAGLQAVSIEPETLNSLEKSGYVTAITSERMKEIAVFDNNLDHFDATEGLYVFINKENELTKELADHFPDTDVKAVHIQNKEFLFIPGIAKKTEENPLGYLPETVSQIKQAGLSVIFRMPNMGELKDDLIFKQLAELTDEESNRVLFLGQEVAGSPNPQEIKAYANQFKEKNIAVYGIEFADQKGFFTLANQMDMNVIRLHSLDLNRVDSPQEGIDRAIRAVKERNIRAIFLRMEHNIGGENSLINMEGFITDVHHDMPSIFHPGKAEMFNKITIPAWSYVAAFAAAIFFVSLAALSVFGNRILFLLAFVGMLALALGYAVLHKTLLVQGTALLVAIIAPVFAILPVSENKGMKHIIVAYIRAALISAMGIAIVVALLNGNEYLVKVEAFRGVKLIYVFPILFMFLYAIRTQIKGLLTTRVEYWHLAFIAVIGVIGLYYISRTGNAGSVSDIELVLRQKLEEAMYVRPRTKEFLIGLPFFVLALYVIPYYKKLGFYLLIPGVIGYLSIVNTFTHLHIPLYVSILRTVYSLILGLIIGWIFILVYKKGHALFMNKIKPRWFA